MPLGRRLLRATRDYVLLPAVGLLIALVARAAVDDAYTSATLYCWKGMQTLRLVTFGYLAVVAALAFSATHSYDSRARKGFTRAWNVAATAVVLAAVYIDALLDRACNE